MFELVALTVMMIMLVRDLPGLGYPQAIMVVVASGWFAAIGFRLVGDSEPPAGSGSATERPMSVWPVCMMSAEVSRPLPADGVLTLGGREVHVVAQTVPGPLVIMLGGCGVPSYAWDDTVELLPDCSILRLDRPGLVRTPWPGVLPDLSAEVETLVELIERMEVPAVLVAHSIAGLHAEALARRRPDLVAALVLADSSADWRARRPGSGAAGSGRRSWLAARSRCRRCERWDRWATG